MSAHHVYNVCPECLRETPEHPEHGDPDSIDAAWAEAEVALRAWFDAQLPKPRFQYDASNWPGTGIRLEGGARGYYADVLIDDDTILSARGDTPAAALRALAEKLREVK